MDEDSKVYGRYRLTRLLGRGGMAEGWQAETEPGAGIVRTVALKRVFRSSPEMLADLVEEARVWVRLQHPNIVSVTDFGELEGEWFLVLELVDGTTAAEIVRELGALEVREALCVVER